MRFESREFQNRKNLDEFMNEHVKKGDVYNYQIIPYARQENVPIYFVSLLIIEKGDPINQSITVQEVSEIGK